MMLCLVALYPMIISLCVSCNRLMMLSPSTAAAFVSGGLFEVSARPCTLNSEAFSGGPGGPAWNTRGCLVGGGGGGACSRANWLSVSDSKTNWGVDDDEDDGSAGGILLLGKFLTSNWVTGGSARPGTLSILWPLSNFHFSLCLMLRYLIHVLHVLIGSYDACASRTNFLSVQSHNHDIGILNSEIESW